MSFAGQRVGYDLIVANLVHGLKAQAAELHVRARCESTQHALLCQNVQPHDTLARCTSNYADARGCRTRRGRTACGKNVICVWNASSTANQLEPSLPAGKCAAAATSARIVSTPKLRGLGPGGCGAAPPPPPPAAKPSVSPSGETGNETQTKLLLFIGRGDDPWWQCGLGEGSKEHVAWDR